MNKYLACVVFVLFSSCSGLLMNEMQRSNTDPSIAVLKAESFILPNQIFLSWEADSNADFYILYKSDIPTFSSARKIYYGKNCNYIDKSGMNDTFYFYWLSKVRGDKVFDVSKETIAVLSDKYRDLLEPNDEPALATELKANLSANSYYYLYGMNRYFVDEDWYYITLASRQTLSFTLTASPGSSGNYLFMQENDVEKVITTAPVSISNLSLETKTIRFRIRPEMITWISANKGSVFKSYDLSIKMIAYN